MIRILIFVALHFVALLPNSAFAQEETEPKNERASAFVDGEVDPKEAFGSAEGPVLLILGLAALALVFVFLIASKRTQTGNSKELRRIEEQLLPKGDSDGP